MLPRSVPNQEGCLQLPLQAILRQTIKSTSSIRYANDQQKPNAFRSSICALSRAARGAM